jgi:hypothetical protein
MTALLRTAEYKSFSFPSQRVQSELQIQAQIPFILITALPKEILGEISGGGDEECCFNWSSPITQGLLMVNITGVEV